MGKPCSSVGSGSGRGAVWSLLLSSLLSRDYGRDCCRSTGSETRSRAQGGRR